MKLLADIIDILSDEKTPTSNALLKSQVLAHKLGDEKLAAWVTSELQGYHAESILPEYRIVTGLLRGTIENHAERRPNVILPTFMLTEEIKNYLTLQNIRFGIGSLESMKGRDDISVPLLPEYFHLFSSGLTQGCYISSARCTFPPGMVDQIILQIRSRLLQFCLSLSSQISSEMNDSEIRSKANAIGSQEMFMNAIFGDNAVISINGDNNATISNSVIKNDLESLIAALQSFGIQESDLKDLTRAVAEDGDSVKKQLGPRVHAWVASILAKANSAAFNVSTSTAAGLITTALQKFYGI